jgi:hypothetical protein
MPRPVCVRCKREMTMTTLGATVEFHARAARPAVAEPNGSRPEQGPYQSWAGDVYGCEGCGARVVPQYGQQPVWQVHQGDEGRPRGAIVVLEH